MNKNKNKGEPVKEGNKPYLKRSAGYRGDGTISIDSDFLLLVHIFSLLCDINCSRRAGPFRVIFIRIAALLTQEATCNQHVILNHSSCNNRLYTSRIRMKL